MLRTRNLARMACLIAAACSFAGAASAQQLADNWNTAACDVTDLASLSINRPTRLQRVDLWYHWPPNESSVGYTVSRNGGVVARGELSRAECDPYQAAWCVARVEPGADLEPGIYEFRTARAGICQNAGSGGQGFIKAFGSDQ